MAVFAYQSKARPRPEPSWIDLEMARTALLNAAAELRRLDKLALAVGLEDIAERLAPDDGDDEFYHFDED